jgi:mannose-6-phosphate isomerase-like protein (cupin superfamily)
VALDEVEQIDWRRTGITWRPVRRALGADIVGIAVFTADRSGEVVVEPHTEVDGGRGQQEIYVVLRGKARFVIDGTEVEAPAGTLLRVDPQAHREAVATEAGTAVLALGGESTFEPSASEWIERARPHIRANSSRAREIIEDRRRELPGDRGIDAGEALLALGQGDEPTARAIVGHLVKDLPHIRKVLAEDPDLRALLPAD